jgi:hypothetical protein
MIALMLYYPGSASARIASDYARDFERLHGQAIDLVDMNTIDGDRKASLYGISQYPAILALKDDGTMLQTWQGEYLPLMNELAGYINMN